MIDSDNEFELLQDINFHSKYFSYSVHMCIFVYLPNGLL